MILTIINCVVLVAFIILGYMLYVMITSLGEIMVKFVEQNQEYYKNQKNLIEKSCQLAVDMKKIIGLNNDMKRTVTKIQESAKSLEIKDHVDNLKMEISHISSESSKLNSYINKLSFEVSKLSKIKKE